MDKDILVELKKTLMLLKQVIEAPVDGLGMAREDLGVRTKPRPYKKLPEAK